MVKKIFKVKTVAFQRVGRVLLWTLLIFLLLRGIGSIFTSKTGEGELIQAFMMEKDYQEKVEREATAFAEGFLMEYFTYERGADYEQRIRRYISSQMNLPNHGNGKIKALNARATSIDWFSNNQINVAVDVRVQYEIKNGEEAEIIKVMEDNIYALVPVMEHEGKYIIEDYPSMLPRPEKADISLNFVTATGLDSTVTEELTEVIESFFRTYCSGSPNEISYYMHKNEKLKGLENRYRFIRLEGIKAYEGNSKEEMLVLAEMLVEDSISQLQYKQGYHLIIVKEDRYYIKEFNVRTVNLTKGED